jgi:hypothetical protein
MRPGCCCIRRCCGVLQLLSGDLFCSVLELQQGLGILGHITWLLATLRSAVVTDKALSRESLG